MQFEGYKFVVAAALFQNYGGLAIYIRYRRSARSDIWIKEAGKNHIWYVCPDRELVLVRNAFDPEAFRPDNFDQCVDLNVFRDAFGASVGIDYFMTNYTHSSAHPTHRDKVAEKDKQVCLLSDSGGLQLAREVSGLIHPKDLVEFYNLNVDAGMVLDIPLWVNDAKIARRAALLQRANNEVMLRHSRPGLELINIFHGGSLEDRMKYREIVEDDRIPRVAIGGLLLQKQITAVNTIYELVNSGIRYKQYHALGVFDMSYIALLVKMANSGENPPHITSDSTSHVQASLTSTWFSQMTEQSIMNRIPIGTNAGSIANPALPLNCNCPVCSTLKYRDILAMGHNRFNGFLALHNAIAMSTYTRGLQEACRSLTPDEYNKYVMVQLRHVKTRGEVKHALDYIDAVTNYGLRKAQHRYDKLLGNWKQAEKRPPALFEVATDVSDGKPKASHAELLERTSKLLSLLENQLN